jgi:hypothetical protein
MLLSPIEYAETALIFGLNLIGCLWLYHTGLGGALIEATIVALIFYGWRLETALRRERAERARDDSR